MTFGRVLTQNLYIFKTLEMFLNTFIYFYNYTHVSGRHKIDRQVSGYSDFLFKHPLLLLHQAPATIRVGSQVSICDVKKAHISYGQVAQ